MASTKQFVYLRILTIFSNGYFILSWTLFLHMAIVTLQTLTRDVKNCKRLLPGVRVCLDLGYQSSEETPEVIFAEVVRINMT